MASASILLLTLLFFFTSHSLAVSWHYLTYWAPKNGQFTGFSGEMHIPTLPHAGTYYLWPGLQPTDNSGVYQEVLDGRAGTWWIAPGWCCSNPTLPWGNGFNTTGGDVVAFNNLKGPTAWSSTVQNATGALASSSFTLGDKSFNQAIFAIELYGEEWDFGPLAFTNIEITAQGTDKSWCTKKPANQNTNYTITGLTSSVAHGVVTCKIESLVLEGPGSG